MTEETAATEDPTPQVEKEGAPAAPTTDDAKPAEALAEKPAGEEANAAETTETDAKAEETPKPKKRRASAATQRRIDNLTKRASEAERKLAEATAPKDDEPPSAPKRDDFELYEDFVAAKSVYAAEEHVVKRISEERERVTKETAEDRERAQVESFNTARDSVIDAGIEAYSDFEEVTMTDDLQITKVMAGVLVSSDDGASLWYHLGKNPQEADRIAALPPVKQAYEMGRLATTLKSGKAPSNAPKPIKTVGPRGSETSTVPTDDMSTKDWMNKRYKQLKAV